MTKSKTKEQVKQKKKSNVTLGKETYGTMPIEECFKKAFAPYFDPEKEDEYYVNKLR